MLIFAGKTNKMANYDRDRAANYEIIVLIIRLVNAEKQSFVRQIATNMFYFGNARNLIVYKCVCFKNHKI